MQKSAISIKRRTFLGSAIMAASGFIFARSARVKAKAEKTYSLFNGKNLNGWILVENGKAAFSPSDITDLSSLAKSITSKSNAVSAFVNAGLDDAVRASFSESASSNPGDEKSLRSALARNLDQIVSGPSIFDQARFHGVHMGCETVKLLRRDPGGKELIKLNRMLLSDAFPAGLRQFSQGWTVIGGVMASTGSGRGVLYTARDYGRFRLMFTMRHVSGDPDHPACVLVLCTRPAHDAIPLDALGGIQFQVPKGRHCDYRPGHNNDGGIEFTTISKPEFDPHQWSRVEIVADDITGMVRMAVAQPLGSKAVEVLRLNEPTAGKPGPIELQMHNTGLFDEYKDITIDENLQSLDLITVTWRVSRL